MIHKNLMLSNTSALSTQCSEPDCLGNQALQQQSFAFDNGSDNRFSND